MSRACGLEPPPARANLCTPLGACPPTKRPPGRAPARTVIGPDGVAFARELDDFSFAQAQVNMHMGKKVCFAPDASMTDGLLDLVLVTRSGALDILEANALARGASHVELPYVEVLRCRSYRLTPRRAPAGLDARAVNLDGELVTLPAGPFRARCVPGALEVFAELPLNAERVDTSDALEPRLVMAAVELLR